MHDIEVRYKDIIKLFQSTGYKNCINNIWPQYARTILTTVYNIRALHNAQYASVLWWHCLKMGWYLNWAVAYIGIEGLTGIVYSIGKGHFGNTEQEYIFQKYQFKTNHIHYYLMKYKIFNIFSNHPHCPKNSFDVGY